MCRGLRLTVTSSNWPPPCDKARLVAWAGHNCPRMSPSRCSAALRRREPSCQPWPAPFWCLQPFAAARHSCHWSYGCRNRTLIGLRPPTTEVQMTLPTPAPPPDPLLPDPITPVEPPWPRVAPRRPTPTRSRRRRRPAAASERVLRAAQDASATETNRRAPRRPRRSGYRWWPTRRGSTSGPALPDCSAGAPAAARRAEVASGAG